jgi:hypothetical protein
MKQAARSKPTDQRQSEQRRIRRPRFRGGRALVRDPRCRAGLQFAVGRIAPAVAAISLLGTASVSPASAFVSRPCYQTGPQIWITSSGIDGQCFSPGGTISMQYSAASSQSPGYFWGAATNVTASSAGTLTDVVLKEPSTQSFSQIEMIDGYDLGSSRGSNVLYLDIPASRRNGGARQPQSH